jgi:hypothetical protein
VTRAGGGFALSATLDGPAPVAVDLRSPRRFPLGWHPATLDCVLLCLGQPRPARLDHRRVDNLSAHRQPPLGLPQRVKPREQRLRRAVPRQLLAEQPDRLGVRDGACRASPTNRMNDSRSFSSVWPTDKLYSVSATPAP